MRDRSDFSKVIYDLFMSMHEGNRWFLFLIFGILAFVLMKGVVLIPNKIIAWRHDVDAKKIEATKELAIALDSHGEKMGALTEALNRTNDALQLEQHDARLLQSATRRLGEADNLRVESEVLTQQARSSRPRR